MSLKVFFFEALLPYTDYVLYDKCFTGDSGYPSTVELPDGKLLTVFYTHDYNASLEKPEKVLETPAVIKQIIWEIEN